MESTTVGDWMSPQFVSVPATIPVVEAASLLVSNELLGGPVVDDKGRLVGWISEQDCLGAVVQVYYHGQRVATVADVMRTEVLSVRPDDSVVDLADRMRGNKPKIYPVLDAEGKVIGVISRRRILRRMCALIAGQKA